MTPDQIVSQFQQILATMQRMIAASAELAGRVDALEQIAGDISGKMTSIDGTVQLMLDSIQSASDRQIAAYEAISRRVTQIEAQLERLNAGPSSETAD